MKPTYKPFDLEAAKSGTPIICRDGNTAKFIAYVPELDPNTRVFYLRQGSAILTGVHTGGHRMELSSNESPLDLFMAPTKHKGWVNIYEENGARFTLNPSREEADARGNQVSATNEGLVWNESQPEARATSVMGLVYGSKGRYIYIYNRHDFPIVSDGQFKDNAQAREALQTIENNIQSAISKHRLDAERLAKQLEISVARWESMKHKEDYLFHREFKDMKEALAAHWEAIK